MQQWEMTEVFTFPSVLGNVLEGTSFKVEPNWQQELKDESILLRGVYVVKGHVNFDFEPVEDAKRIEGISIEHLDIEKDKAYFEYAIPFSIDLPNDGDANVKIKVIDPQVSIMPGANCSCTWQVRCEIEKKEAIVEETLIKVKKAEVNNVIKQQNTEQINETIAAKEKIEPNETTAAKEKIEPKETTAVKEKIEPKETTAVKEKIEPKETTAAKETNEPKEITSAKEKTEPKETTAVKEKIEPKETTAAKETNEPKEITAAKETIESKEITAVKETIESEEISAPKETIASKEIVEGLEEIKTVLAESKFSTSEEIDFFDQLAEAYSVIQVHLNKK